MKRFIQIESVVVCMAILNLQGVPEVIAETVTTGVSVASPTFSEIAGIAIVAGGQLTIVANGSACADSACTPSVSPVGLVGQFGSSQAMLTGAPLWGLICGIGGQTQGDLFFVGTAYSQTASQSGSLSCGMNEDPATLSSYSDNSGSWTISVTFTPEGEPTEEASVLSCWTSGSAEPLTGKISGQICLDLDMDTLDSSKKVHSGGGYFSADEGNCKGTHPALFAVTPDDPGFFRVGVTVMRMKKPNATNIKSCYPIIMDILLSTAIKEGIGASWNREEAAALTGLKERHSIRWTNFIELSQ